MGIFNQDKNKLIWHHNGEKMIIESWGKNSLRVRSRMMGEPIDTDFALLLVEKEHEVDIKIEEKKAIIRNGKIRAELEEEKWTKNCIISYYN